MTFKTNQNANVLEVTVAGRLDTVTAPDLEKAIIPLPKDVNEMLFDFNNLDYISSAGLRVLLHAHRSLPMGGKTKVVNCNPVVKEVFSATGFADMMEIE